MAKKRPKSERIEIEVKQEFLSFQEPVQHVIEGVTVLRDDWFALTGEITQHPVRLLRLPDELSSDDREALRIGKALRELRNLLPNDGKSRIEITGNYVATASEGRLAVEKTIFDDDCELNDAAAPFERLLAKVHGKP